MTTYLPTDGPMIPNTMMKTILRPLSTILLHTLLGLPLFAQSPGPSLLPAPDRLPGDGDKCGGEIAALAAAEPRWGYGYADLLVDLERWGKSPYVTIDTLGRSVQNRLLWELTITDDAPGESPRKTVYIHARTHPGEVQSWWVANSIIDILLSDESYARRLREECVFHIVPMYNPDGVEIESPRHNANDIDLEREWDKEVMQPEAAALKKRFTELMASDSPIRIALNLHSAYICRRYFVFHDATGTSHEFANLEREFITETRETYPEGIEPWDYNITWKNETPTHFPESWFWLNHGASVMALTYEDMNCETAGDYHTTAAAILDGVTAYLDITTISSAPGIPAAAGELTALPMRPRSADMREVRFSCTLPEAASVRLTLHTVTGEVAASIDRGTIEAGRHEIVLEGGDLPPGLYLYRITAGERSVSGRVPLGW